MNKQLEVAQLWVGESRGKGKRMTEWGKEGGELRSSEPIRRGGDQRRERLELVLQHSTGLKAGHSQLYRVPSSVNLDNIFATIVENVREAW